MLSRQKKLFTCSALRQHRPPPSSVYVSSFVPSKNVDKRDRLQVQVCINIHGSILRELFIQSEEEGLCRSFIYQARFTTVVAFKIWLKGYKNRLYVKEDIGVVTIIPAPRSFDVPLKIRLMYVEQKMFSEKEVKSLFTFQNIC